MADIKVKYQSSVQTLTISGLDSLAGGSYTTEANCAAVDNSSDLFVDVLVEVLIDDGMTPAGNKQVIVYAIDSLDGTNWSDSNSSNPQGMRLLGVVPMNGTPAPGWRSPVMSLAAAFGGVVPPKWKLILYNDNSTTALNSSGNSVTYRGVHFQSV